MTYRTALLVNALLFLAFGPLQPVPQAETDVLAPYRELSTNTWEMAITQLETRDETEADPDDAILFVGSSSIRLWNNIALDMRPWPVIQRGFGGARTSDVAVYAERLLHPHDYRALVLFLANDVSGRDDDHSPPEVDALMRHILEVSRAHRPEAPVFLIEVTPTRNRWKHWPRTRKINQALRELALTSPNTWFIPTAEHYLDANKEPREDLFVQDRLHLNSPGYRQWSRLIQRRLEDVLGTP